jgi:competence protein ComEA
MDELIERSRNWLAGVLLVAALGAAVALAAPLLHRPAAPPVQLVASSAAPPTVQIHIVGAVRQPGVYALPAGSRVADAVEAAGAADDADLAALNLAARLTDGQRLRVPPVGEASPAPTAAPERARAAAAPPARVNLNTASAAELDALPGIGPALARRILEYRAQHGPFTAVEQLRDARLLPRTTYERVRDYLTVE